MVAEEHQNIDRVSTDILPTIDIPTAVIAGSDDFVLFPTEEPTGSQSHPGIEVCPGGKGRTLSMVREP